MKKIAVTIIIFLLFALGVFISYILYSDVEERTITNQYQQQDIYSKQAVLSIENFFDNFRSSLDFLSKKEEVINFNDESKNLLKNYFEAHIDGLEAITRISPEGKIISTYPYVKDVIGKDISSQPHNAEIIEKHEPIISDVFITVQGYRAIVFAYPVFRNSEYDGCVSLVIPFNYIANKFLQNIKLGDNGKSFVISESGIELYCSNSNHIGKSIYDNKNIGEINIFADKMLDRQEVNEEYLLSSNTKNNDLMKYLVVNKTVNLGNTFWSIAICVSKDEALEANRGFMMNLLALLILMLVLLTLFLYFYARERRKSRAKLLEKEQKYKIDLENLVDIRTDELSELNESLREDIIERKKIEAELKNAIDRVEKSDKLKSEFLAQMSHEIRTPINTILSFSGLIRDELLQHADEELKYGFSGIQTAGKRLIRTIDLILNMSDVQLGTHEYIPKKIELCEDIIDNLIIEYRVQVNEKNLELNLLKKTNDTTIIADSYTVNQIFANLIHNAIKYTLKGKIDIECDRNSKGEFFVSIIDTGIGISKEYLPRLFDEFSQEDNGYTRKFEGNGLGLALVKKYCTLNNAEITVSSEKNIGSKFTVTFK